MSEGSVLALPCLLVSSSAAVLEVLIAESFTLQSHLHRVGSALESTGYLASPEPPGVTGVEEEEHKWEGMSAPLRTAGSNGPFAT